MTTTQNTPDPSAESNPAPDTSTESQETQDKRAERVKHAEDIQGRLDEAAKAGQRPAGQGQSGQSNTDK